jgi:hypothetical protein
VPAHNGSPLTPPNALVTPIAPVPPPAIPPTSFPPTNAVGQRICRQCGLPGRYKDNKCVEKWGPGPEGPGTVCDRCRKKMKRVERRGTTDANAGGSNNASAARLHRTDTIPVGPITGTPRQTQSQSQSQVFPSSASFVAPVLLQDKKRASGSAKDRERDRNRDPPSPPAIATLQTTDDEDPGRRRRGAVSSGG